MNKIYFIYNMQIVKRLLNQVNKDDVIELLTHLRVYFKNYRVFIYDYTYR